MNISPQYPDIWVFICWMIQWVILFPLIRATERQVYLVAATAARDYHKYLFKKKDQIEEKKLQLIFIFRK